MRSRFAPDARLIRRMLVTLALLSVLYVAFAAALIALGVGAAIATGVVVAVLVVLHLAGDRMVVAAMGAREVSPAEAPELHAMLDRLCALADLPKPRLAVSESAEPNAFAAGHTSRRAVICVTRGLLDRVDRRELEGVLAHELSHVAHRDVALGTIVSVFGVAAGLLWGMAIGLGLGPRRRFLIPLGLVVAAVAAVVHVVSLLLTRAFSRYRELAADRDGALLTQQPSALASALTKITEDLSAQPAHALRGSHALNGAMFAPGLSGDRVNALLATHPPTARRLEQLRWIATELGT
ncbi:M48 family metalloprotease [Nonomuraea soli]|uniref:Protease HtpX homolog n=1 Tax=Nonomuraea soli TaxID=1032476 RepID=A0A7W0CE39_9ACTN|nr:M48 family metalloprotease [Nonomuraea soli]MBA2889444.1 heat shock protein HtpX [Nonomuraea soli]